MGKILNILDYPTWLFLKIQQGNKCEGTMMNFKCLHQHKILYHSESYFQGNLDHMSSWKTWHQSSRPGVATNDPNIAESRGLESERRMSRTMGLFHKGDTGELALQLSPRMRKRNGQDVWKLASRLRELLFAHKPHLFPQFSCALFLEAGPMSKTWDCVELLNMAREWVQKILDCAWPINTYPQ